MSAKIRACFYILNTAAHSVFGTVLSIASRFTFFGSVGYILALLTILFAGVPASAEVPPYTYTVTVDDIPFVPLISICAAQGISVQWDGSTQKALLSKDESYLIFMADEPLANVNGVIIPIERAPKILNGTFLVPETTTVEVWWPWRKDSAAIPQTYTPAVEELKYDIRRIVIDPGHGGEDQGIRPGGDVLEKSVALEVAQKLAGQLRQIGFEVTLTRNDDTYVPLKDRIRVISEQKPDIFLSLHANHSENANISGLEIYYYSDTADEASRLIAGFENTASQKVIESEKPEDQKESAGTEGEQPFMVRPAAADPVFWDVVLSEQRTRSVMLARLIGSALTHAQITENQGVKSAKFKVLLNSRVPALVVELGYLSNSVEAQKLADPAYQDQMAAVLAEALVKYKEEYERTKGYTSQSY